MVRVTKTQTLVFYFSGLIFAIAKNLYLSHSNLYWTDWNREAPKIEMSSLEGENRRILVNKDIGLPNGLTFDPFSKLLCWADAGITDGMYTQHTSAPWVPALNRSFYNKTKSQYVEFLASIFNSTASTESTPLVGV